jgi:hypothetical protein
MNPQFIAEYINSLNALVRADVTNENFMALRKTHDNNVERMSADELIFAQKIDDFLTR